MNFSWMALILTLSFSCLVASYFILPRIALRNTEINASLNQELAGNVDTIRLPAFLGGFEATLDDRDVSAGDTLGYIINDRYADLRDSLSAFAKTGYTKANFNFLPAPFRDELVSFLPSVSEHTSAPTTSTRFTLRGVEREYLASEIMGAEDATTEIIGKLSHLTDAGKASSSAYDLLENQLRQKQYFISNAKKRLSEKEEFIILKRQSNSSKKSTLTEAQRNRILNISIELPIDTQRVFAPIDGSYHRPDSGIGYILAKATSAKPSLSPAVDRIRSSYTLEAEGSPILWGTAQRNDSLDRSTSAKKNSVQVLVK